jgi:hypothetical protein
MFAARWYVPVLVAASLVMVLLSCTEKNCLTVCEVCQECARSREHPDSLLVFLADAYEGKNIEAYSSALHESFLFEFTPEIAESLGLCDTLPFWHKADDIASTQNMFSDPDVKLIEMEFCEAFVGDYWEDCWREFITVDPPETTLIQGLCLMFEPEIKVHIEKPDEDPRVLWVGESLVDVMVAPDPRDEGQWVFVRIKEVPKSPWMSATEPSTWAGIKRMFQE